MQPLAASNEKRIESIDLLRGLVMIIMALDHTRDYFHSAANASDPLDLATTTPFLYFTRWITHFCAPTFVFLSGVSAWLQSRRKTRKELSRFLISRGVWLVIIEIAVIGLSITADIHYSFLFLQTIWSIGISMIILGLVIWLPYNAIFFIGLVIVLGHNSIDFAEAGRNGNVPVWWNFLHRPAVVSIDANHSVGIFYPFLPWAGLMILGYCAGKLFSHLETARRNKILLGIGIGALLLFIVLRFANWYGDPGHWVRQKNLLYTFLDFMDVQKYPPSLLYMCATVGSALIFLAVVKNTKSRLAKIIIIYGRVPFFYYILHFYLLSSLNIMLYLSRGHSISEGMKGIPGLPFKVVMPGEGYSLWLVYCIWLAVVVVLYPLCRWYDHYKTRHKEKWWLSYL